MKVLIDLPRLPEGWEYTGEYRSPKDGEYFYCPILEETFMFEDGLEDDPCFIIRKVKWRAKYRYPYWFVSDALEPLHTYDYREDSDEKRYLAGNYFKTCEEAKQAADKFKQLLKGF